MAQRTLVISSSIRVYVGGCLLPVQSSDKEING